MAINCTGVLCSFGCAGGCAIICAASGGVATAVCALGGTFGGSGTAIALNS